MITRKIGPLTVRAITSSPKYLVEIEHHKSIVEFSDHSLDGLVFDVALHINGSKEFNQKVSDSIKAMFNQLK